MTPKEETVTTLAWDLGSAVRAVGQLESQKPLHDVDT